MVGVVHPQAAVGVEVALLHLALEVLEVLGVVEPLIESWVELVEVVEVGLPVHLR